MHDEAQLRVALAADVMHFFFCCLSPKLSDRSEAG